VQATSFSYWRSFWVLSLSSHELVAWSCWPAELGIASFSKLHWVETAACCLGLLQHC